MDKKIKMRHILKIFPVDRKTITRWCNKKNDPMPHTLINGQYYFNLTDVQIWDEKRSNESNKAS